jgi:pimeloyl-ACP methyl ester carboxylesterase
MAFANNNGVKIHYEVEGHGPPLILMHGFAGSLERWKEVGYAEALGKEYRLILVDARGCGQSDKPHDPKDYDLRLMAGDLVAILDALKIEKANYFGYSMGGRIGFRIPLVAPGRFSALVLGGAAYPVKGDEDKKDDTLVSVKESLEIALREPSEKIMETYVTLMEKRSGLMPPMRRALQLQNDPLALIAAIKAHTEGISPKPEEVLPLFTMPCLVIVGEADPRFPSAKESARRMPNARFVTLPGLNHAEGLAHIEMMLPPPSKSSSSK